MHVSGSRDKSPGDDNVCWDALYYLANRVNRFPGEIAGVGLVHATFGGLSAFESRLCRAAAQFTSRSVFRSCAFSLIAITIAPIACVEVLREAFIGSR
jgi:hypothetical protein